MPYTSQTAHERVVNLAFFKTFVFFKSPTSSERDRELVPQGITG